MTLASSFQFELLVLFSLVGLVLSAWIFVTKLRKKKLICVTRDECMSVVTGSYSTIMGIPNEILGMGYHFLVIAYAMAGIMNPEALDVRVVSAMYAISTIATLFAVRLVYIQAFVIKKWCEWCLAISLCSGMMYWLITLP